jgi:hypothetical protein
LAWGLNLVNRDYHWGYHFTLTGLLLGLSDPLGHGPIANPCFVRVNLNPPLRILSTGLNLTLGRGICSDKGHTPRAQCVIAYNKSFAEKDRFIFAANRRQIGGKSAANRRRIGGKTAPNWR